MKETLIKTLLPWLFYAGCSLLGFPKVAAPAALLVLVAGGLMSGYSFKPVDFVLMLYFAVVAVGIGLLHWTWLAALQPVVAPAMLASMAFGTVLLRRPFTLPYAREMVKDPVIRKSHHFYRVNTILSILWGLAFLLAALGQAWALGQPGKVWIATLGAFAVTGLVACFTAWFPGWYHKRFYHKAMAQLEAEG
jgi:hypothetical protein